MTQKYCVTRDHGKDARKKVAQRPGGVDLIECAGDKVARHLSPKKTEKDITCGIKMLNASSEERNKLGSNL